MANQVDLPVDTNVKLPVPIFLGKGTPTILNLDHVFSAKVGDNESRLPVRVYNTDSSPYNLNNYSVNVNGWFEDGTTLSVEGFADIKDTATGQVDLVFPANCFAQIGLFTFEVEIDNGTTKINSVDIQIMVHDNHFIGAINTEVYQDKIDKLWQKFLSQTDVTSLTTTLKAGTAAIEAGTAAAKDLQTSMSNADLPTNEELTAQLTAQKIAIEADIAKKVTLADTGWIECIVADGTVTSSGASSLHARTYGGTTYIDGLVMPKAVHTPFANISKFISLPEGWEDVRVPCATSNGGVYTVSFAADGTVQLSATSYDNNDLAGGWCHIKGVAFPIN